MDNLYSKKERKQEVRSKRLLTEAFFELLYESPGKPITVKDLCKRADYTRPTFYAHFDQIEDVPYYHYKNEWLNEYFEEFASLKEQDIRLDEINLALIHKSFSYWTTQVETYKLLKSIDLDQIFLRLHKEGTEEFYKTFHSDPDRFLNSLSGKCIIKSHAQLSISIYDLWAYSGKKMDTDEMASILLKIINGTSGLE